MQQISQYLALFSATMSFVMAYFFLFTDLFVDRLSGTKRTVFIVILLAYGTFRLVRFVLQLKKKKDEK